MGGDDEDDAEYIQEHYDDGRSQEELGDLDGEDFAGRAGGDTPPAQDKVLKKHKHKSHRHHRDRGDKKDKKKSKYDNADDEEIGHKRRRRQK